MKKLIKNTWYLLIPTIMLLFALADNPYGYYQILRWVVMLFAGYVAFLSYENKHKIWLWVFVGIAILFNPLTPIHLSRELWSVIDVIVAVFFSVNMWLLKNKKNILN